MSSFKFIAPLLLLVLPALADYNPNTVYPLQQSIPMSFGGESLMATACRSWNTGRYPSLENIPTYPRVIASSLIQETETGYCGTCWSVTTFGGESDPETFYAVMIDTMGGTSSALAAFSVPEDVIDSLSDGSMPLVQVQHIDSSYCGM